MEPADHANADVEIPCPECDYNLHNVTSDRCPWCGWTIDFDLMLAQVRAPSSGRRFGVAIAAFAVGIGALVALVSLTIRGSGLGLFDGFIVLSVVLASVGHLSLGVLVLVRRKHWPLRRGAAADLTIFAAWLSMALGVVGAIQFLTELPVRRIVRGVAVGGVLEFVAAAILLVLPGVMLLVLHLVSFRDRRPVTTRRLEPPGGSSLPIRASFIVEFMRRCRSDGLTQSWTEAERPTSDTIERMIAHAWGEQSRVAVQRGRALYNGSLVRLVRASAAPTGDYRPDSTAREGLHLELGPTTFQEFLGTNLFNAGAVLTENRRALSDALGVSAVVFCSDYVLVLGRRGEKVAFHSGHLHTFGGLVELTDRRPDGTYDVFGAMIRELREEAGVEPGEIRDLSIIALVRDRDILQPELIFEAVLDVTSKELLSRFDASAPGQEHSALELVFSEPDAILPFLSRSAPVAPVAEAALLLHGRESFGQDWYEQTCFVLYGEMPPSSAQHFANAGNVEDSHGN